MKKSTKITWTVIGAVALAALLWLAFRPTAKDSVSLETDTVKKIDISSSVTATGTVEPVTEVEVGTQVSGIIDKLYADYNDVVKAGQVIAEMDKVTLQAELKSATATLGSGRLRNPYPVHYSAGPHRHAGDRRCGRGRHRTGERRSEGLFHS